MNFINFRGFKHAIGLVKGDYDDPNDKGEVSHFQALTTALSATVGLGNIAGVALNLGVAFNSTFVALLLSLILTFLSTSLRGRDYDRLVRSKQFISEALGSHLTRIRVAA